MQQIAIVIYFIIIPANDLQISIINELDMT